VDVLNFAPSYLESCICPDAISQWIRQRNSIKRANLEKKNATKTLAMIRQALQRLKKGETSEEQTQENALNFV
jgi:hypothetical protein